MYVSVDDDQAPTFTEGYCYTNQNGAVEYVKMDGNINVDYRTVYVEDSMGQYCEIYANDIPKLIKALQAAYDHKGQP